MTETAGKFARRITAHLRTLGASDARSMEKGQMRVEPKNISVSTDPTKFGTQGSVKTWTHSDLLNVQLHMKLREWLNFMNPGKENENYTGNTRLRWRENKKKNFSQKNQENANDYRYFPWSLIYLTSTARWTFGPQEPLAWRLPGSQAKVRLAESVMDKRWRCWGIMSLIQMLGNYFWIRSKSFQWRYTESKEIASKLWPLIW